MSDFRDIDPDEEREVPVEDEDESDAPPPTLDPDERVEQGGELDHVVEDYEAGFEG